MTAAKSACVLSPLPTAVPPSGIRPSSANVAPSWFRADGHLRRVAAELLPERHRHGVHQVGPSRLDDVDELDRLGRERVAEPVERRHEVVVSGLQRGEVDRRREHVVRALTEVDVVVRMGPAVGERADHLVGVHVRRRAGSGLEHVDRELGVVLAGGDRVAGGDDLCGQRGVEEAEFGVRRRRPPT